MKTASADAAKPLTTSANLSFVMVGLDPTIHKPLKRMDPRVKPEDDGVLGASLSSS
ncbi:protein of unknown function [Shinella sp. WSC3-e]|nr:hypothetical protein SHINE37_41820 [Rhizobiaceae bacterium]CAK7256433.1 protein of unknown function [Shinella sp. WSC3-e]